MCMPIHQTIYVNKASCDSIVIHLVNLSYLEVNQFCILNSFTDHSITFTEMCISVAESEMKVKMEAELTMTPVM